MDGVYKIQLLGSEKIIFCKEKDTLISALQHAGIKPFPSGCHGGGCGICKIQIVEGEIAITGVMSSDHITENDKDSGIVLACCVSPLGDITIKSLLK